MDRWWPPSTSILAPQMNSARPRRQEGDRIGDVVGRAPAAERDLGAPPGLLLLEAAPEIDFVVERQRVGQRRLDAARAHGVDQDVARRQFVRQRFDEGVLRRIDDGRGDGVGLRHLAGLPDDDDEAAAALPAHVRDDAAGELPGPDHLGVEMADEVVGRGLVEPAGEMRAGIAHHDVDAAEALDDILDQGRDVGRLAEIGHEAFGLAGAHLRQRGVEPLALAAADRDPAALLAEPARDRETDPAGAAGDQRGLAGKAEVHRRPHPNT